MGKVRLDLHVHSRASPDSSLPIAAIAARANAVGLAGFALTDHNTVAGHADLAESRTKFPNLILIPGVEVSTAEGHLLAYGVSEAPPAGRSVVETVAWVHDRGGVAVLSHPFRRSHGVGYRVATTVLGVAIESVNGHTSPSLNRRAAEVARQRGLPTTGGGDVHELRDLGIAYTEFQDEVTTAEAVLRALREGQMTAGGHALGFAARVRVEVRTTLLRARRGFRSI